MRKNVDHESDSDSLGDIDVHEIARTGTFNELKIAVAMDRPRIVNLKDEVNFFG